MNGQLERKITSFLIEKISPSLIVLFGSTVTGTNRPDSDIDIAYISKQQLDDYERFLLAQELASQLNTDVDLIDLQKASTVFQMQILGTGRVIFCNDENARMAFEMRIYKMYAKLNEERKAVLEQIEESGRVYDE